MAAGDGLISMKPTSIAHAGTSASINADGGVDFSAVTSVSLNGVFTGDYDNYLVVFTNQLGTGSAAVYFRLRTAGSDATGSDYTFQRLYATGATAGAYRTSSSSVGFESNTNSSSPANGLSACFYGPALAQPTAYRSIGMYATLGALLDDIAGTHSLSTSYDGFTIYPNGSDITGTVHVFGYEE